MLLGLIIRDIIDPLDAAVIEAAAAEAGKRNCKVVLGHVRGRADEGVGLWRILESRHCDAITFLGDLLERPEFVAELGATNVLVVAIWHWTQSKAIPTANVDNRVGVTAAIDHLTGLGHQRIAFVSDRRVAEVSLREDVYLAHLGGTGAGMHPDYIQDTSNDPQGAGSALDCLMDFVGPPSAIVCSTDVVALSVLQAAQRRGLKVPEDISITGFDDTLLATVCVPALTTVRQPVREMIRTAMDILFQALEGAGVPGEQRQHVIAPSLGVRGSTGPAARLRHGK